MPLTPLEPTAEFLAAADALGIIFDPGDMDKLGLYLALLLEENKTHNLTAITDPAEAWTKHILDSLTLVPLLADLAGEEAAPAEGGAAPGQPVGPSVIDVGSGGGVPGIPLAIVLPDLRFTLLEATGKKADFLRRAGAALGLSNLAVINGRAERLGQDLDHREVYDAVTARALGHLAVVAELALPLVRPGGIVLAVKGAKAEEEVGEASKAIGLLGGRVAHVAPTPTSRVVVLEKASRTPRPYPRRDGEPKRSPLGVQRAK